MRVSLVEPYWERSKALQKQLETFVEHYGEVDWLEIVVVDDGSPTDPAEPVVNEFRDRLKLVLVKNEQREVWERKDPCIPYNQGVRASTGDILVLAQADISHSTPVLTLMRQLFMQDRTSKLMYPCSFDPHEGEFGYYRANPWRVMPAFDCAMLWRQTWDAVGGMDEQFRDGYGGSDHDFWYALLDKGVTPICVANLAVEHNRHLCSQWVEGQDKFARNQAIIYSKWPDRMVIRVHSMVYPSSNVMMVCRPPDPQVAVRQELVEQRRSDVEAGGVQIMYARTEADARKDEGVMKMFEREEVFFCSSRSGHTAFKHWSETHGHPKWGAMEGVEITDGLIAECKHEPWIWIRDFPNWLASLMKFGKLHGDTTGFIEVWKSHARRAVGGWPRVGFYNDWISRDDYRSELAGRLGLSHDGPFPLVQSNSSFERKASSSHELANPNHRFKQMVKDHLGEHYQKYLRDPEAWELNDALFGRAPQWVGSENQELWESLRG